MEQALFRKVALTFVLLTLSLLVLMPLGHCSSVIVLADDNQKDFWTPGICTINNNIAAKVGNDCLEVVSTGWGYIQHIYTEDQDLTSQSYVSFWLYGNNSGNPFVLIFYDSSWAKHFDYAITDNFDGWQNFIIPYGNFTDTGGMGWDIVRAIKFANVPSQTFYFDRLIAGIDPEELTTEEILGISIALIITFFSVALVLALVRRKRSD